MRRIKKGREPACLADLRSTPGATWSSVYGTQRQEIREGTCADQHWLCAYCMSPLARPPTDVSMKIEHFETRSLAKHLIFDWGNLLGVCLGDVGVKESAEGERRARFHCDTFRGQLPEAQQPLDVHPAAFPPDIGQCFSYTNEGEIRAAPALEATIRKKVEAMIDCLNLNIARLKRNRKAVIETLRDGFRKKKTLPVAKVREALERASIPDGEGLLPPYCEVAAQYLTKKLRQLEAQG